MHRRLAAIAVATALVLTACGQGDDAASSDTTEPDETAEETSSVEASDDLLVEAVWTTTEARSARTSFSAEVDAHGEEVTFGGDGIANFGENRGTLTIDIGQLLTVNGLQGVDGGLQTVFEGTTSYINGDLFTQLFSPPTEWLRFDASELPSDPDANALGEGFGGLTQFAGYDPALGLTLLSGIIAGTVREVGSEAVRGEPTTEYEAKVNVRNALAATAPAVRERLVPRLGEDALDVRAWVDERGLVRRFAYEERGPGGDEDPVVLEYHDFGVQEPVVIPEETSELFDFLQL